MVLSVIHLQKHNPNRALQKKVNQTKIIRKFIPIKWYFREFFYSPIAFKKSYQKTIIFYWNKITKWHNMQKLEKVGRKEKQHKFRIAIENCIQTFLATSIPPRSSRGSANVFWIKSEYKIKKTKDVYKFKDAPFYAFRTCWKEEKKKQQQCIDNHFYHLITISFKIFCVFFPLTSPFIIRYIVKHIVSTVSQ